MVSTPNKFPNSFSSAAVPISNNLAENALRPFTLGRKNWLFCDTPKGAEASAVVYSLVESAKANGIEPFAYLQHVLVQLPYFGKSPSHEELETLMPWAPDIQQDHNEACRFGCYRAIIKHLRSMKQILIHNKTRLTSNQTGKVIQFFSCKQIS